MVVTPAAQALVDRDRAQGTLASVMTWSRDIWKQAHDIISPILLVSRVFVVIIYFSKRA
jgi:hypothetical protein